MNPINQRLEDLREVMRREHLAAFIFPSTDPHQGEYVPDHWKGREYISGFNGSAGTAVVTMHSAALWTDSRYFLAAEEQLRGTGFQLLKLKIEGTPTIPEWIHSQMVMDDGQGSTEVGIDGWCSSANSVKELISDLRKEGGFTLRTNLDPLRQIWSGRPPIPENPVELYPLIYAGETTASKIARIRQALRKQHADGMLMSALDDIAWTLNLRGTDVHCNPVFVSYLLISSKMVTLYVNKVKLTPEVSGYLKAEGVEVADYGEVQNGLKDYFEYNILLDPDEVNYCLYDVVRKKEKPRTEIVEAESPVKRMKTVKNETEIAGFRSAMLKDGIAMVKFLRWLKPAVEAGGQTEISIDQKLTALRAEQPLFRDISFDTIAGYGEHAAIVHYEATPETDIPLQPKGLLLLDSGAQYLDGTTDITRTIALGPLTEEERKIYTLVLKGHIQIELCKFPSGASGTQIDILARKDMWREGLNYLHGTGHGVGTYLNVHEGPHQFRMEWKPAPLVAGMTITDEPGIYLAGRCGARTENTLLIVPYKETEFGQFLQFESLTLCPIDKATIVREMMTQEEIDWLNAYHQRVFDTLSPHLSVDETAWLQEACKAL
ncbi:MAG: aminopeptidase P family protein [Prevotella sp.]|nr:aminopeptidase P family protein [Prevotella sp.]